MLPAHPASGGRAVLAERSDEEVRALYAAPDAPDVNVDVLLRNLRRIRRQGFAVNDQGTETGLIAIGCAVHGRGMAGSPSPASPPRSLRSCATG